MSNNHRMVMFNGSLISEVLLLRLMKIENILKDLNDNKRMNLPDIAAHLQISESTIKKYIKMLGIKMHNKKAWSLADKSKWKETILPMVMKGMLYGEIAKEVGSSCAVVYHWCVRNGIDRKTLYPNWHGAHSRPN